MRLFEKIVNILTLRTAQVAQVVLAFTMLIVVANVIFRIRWNPVPGTVELVEMSGAVLLGMSVAYTAATKGHIMVGVLVERLSLRAQAVVDFIISTISLYFIFLLAKGTMAHAARMMERGFTTGHLLIPVAPSIYLVAFGFSMLALVLFKDLIKASIIVVKGSENK